jgi:hypothetical protein
MTKDSVVLVKDILYLTGYLFVRRLGWLKALRGSSRLSLVPSRGLLRFLRIKRGLSSGFQDVLLPLL